MPKLEIDVREWANWSLQPVNDAIVMLQEALERVEKGEPEEPGDADLVKLLRDGTPFAYVVTRMIPFFSKDIPVITELQYVEVSLQKVPERKLIISLVGNEMYPAADIPPELTSTFAARQQLYLEELKEKLEETKS